MSAVIEVSTGETGLAGASMLVRLGHACLTGKSQGKSVRVHDPHGPFSVLDIPAASMEIHEAGADEDSFELKKMIEALHPGSDLSDADVLRDVCYLTLVQDQGFNLNAIAPVLETFRAGNPSGSITSLGWPIFMALMQGSRTESRRPLPSGIHRSLAEFPTAGIFTHGRVNQVKAQEALSPIPGVGPHRSKRIIIALLGLVGGEIRLNTSVDSFSSPALMLCTYFCTTGQEVRAVAKSQKNRISSGSALSCTLCQLGKWWKQN
eukprot:g20088.t1